MTLPANLNVYISAALFVVGAYAAALYVGMIVWTFRDIHARSRDMLAHILAILLVAVFTLPGLLIYLLLRPHETLAEQYERELAEESLLQDLEERRVCPGCQHRVDPDYIVCPHCHHQLRLRCVGCGRLLNTNWDVCPYCGLYSDRGAADEQTESGELADGPSSQVEPVPVDAQRPQAIGHASVAPTGRALDGSTEHSFGDEVTGNMRAWTQEIDPEDRPPAGR